MSLTATTATFNDGVEITVNDNSNTLKLTSTDADATNGPILRMFRDSSSPADSDETGRIIFSADNDAGEETNFFEMKSSIGDASDGTEDGRLTYNCMVAGTARNVLDITSGNIVFNQDAQNIDFRIESSTNTTMFYLDASEDKIGINTSSPSATLEIHTENNVTAFETQPIVNQNYYAALFRNSSGNDVGNIESTASSTSFGTSSDYRLKENVDYTWDATTRLKQLKPARFNWIVDDTNTLVDGFLAHEVSSIVPEAISGEKDGTETRTKVVLDASGNQLARNVEEADWVKGKEDETFPSDSTWEASKVYPKHQSIDQSKLVPLMVKTIQELEARIKTLEDA